MIKTHAKTLFDALYPSIPSRISLLVIRYLCFPGDEFHLVTLQTHDQLEFPKLQAYHLELIGDLSIGTDCTYVVCDVLCVYVCCVCMYV